MLFKCPIPKGQQQDFLFKPLQQYVPLSISGQYLINRKATCIGQLDLLLVSWQDLEYYIKVYQFLVMLINIFKLIDITSIETNQTNYSNYYWPLPIYMEHRRISMRYRAIELLPLISTSRLPVYSYCRELSMSFLTGVFSR